MPKADMRKVEIQVYNRKTSDWCPILLSKVKYNSEAVMIPGLFRIIVDGVVVFSTMKGD